MIHHLIVLVLAALGWNQQPGAVELHTVRFYRGAGGTLVDAFCRIPYSILDSVRAGGGAAYRVQVSVRDSSGLELTSSDWTQTVRPEILRLPGASAVEHFAFAAVRGRYDIEVTVSDSATGRRSRASSSVEAYASQPLASDLILTGNLRRSTPADSVARGGEIRKGSVFLVATTVPVLTPQDEKLYYYLELYPGRPTQVLLTAHVATVADGRTVFSASPQQMNVSGAGGVAASGLDFAGLAPGSYRLALDIKYSDTTVTRDARFDVAGFEVAAAASGASSSVDSDTSFGSLSEAQLDSAYFPLVHIQEANERGLYEGLTVAGKRTYLRQFWSKRDPNPATPQNENRDLYYVRIAQANQRYREGGAASVPGWRTDRGRILLRYGEPDETLRRPGGATRPYEVWKYTRARPRKFVFFDDTGFGHYALIYSDERREPSRPDWESILGREGAQDVQRF